MKSVLAPIDTNLQNVSQVKGKEEKPVGEKNENFQVQIKEEGKKDDSGKKVQVSEGKGVQKVTGFRTRQHDKKYYTFFLGDYLGKGAFSRVFVFSTSTGEEYAGKICSKERYLNKVDKLKAEILICRTMNHPNVVRFYTFFEDDENYYLIFQLCNHRTLRSVVRQRKKIGMSEIRYYGKQIALGLQYVHQQGIVHRDLKLENIFLHEMEVKIGDFGLALREEDLEKATSVCGTPNYLAPEVIRKKHYTKQVDVWGLGVILFTLATGKPPFECPEVKDIYKKIIRNQYGFPRGLVLDDDFVDLIDKIFVLDPLKRITLDEVLAHPFFQNSPSYLPHVALTSTPKKRKREFSTDKENLPRKKFKKNSAVPRAATLTLIADKLQKFLLNDNSFISSNSCLDEPPISPNWVVKWVDFSCKCALGYTLSNGISGIFFNDGDKISFLPGNDQLLHFCSNTGTKRHLLLSDPETDNETGHKLGVASKITKYMNTMGMGLGFDGLHVEQYTNGEINYLRRWLKTDTTMAFILKDSIQFDFKQDKSKMILEMHHERVSITFIDKTGRKYSKYLDNIILSEVSPSFKKRAEYCRDFIRRYILL